MAVAINSTRKTVEISWDTSGGETEPSPPDGFPSHPIAPGGGEHPSHPIAPGGEAPDNTLPPVEGPVDPDYGVEEGHPDHTLPGDLPHPDQGLPGDQPHPDQGLPPSGVGPSHPIYLPPYVDNSLPGPQPSPEHPIVLPPEIEEGLPPEKLEQIKEFLLGNLPPFSGGPEYPAPVAGRQVEAVQVFAQGQSGDWSNTPVMPNDGLAALAYPKDFKGESYIEVRGLDGTLVDSGTISVK
jgi:hypothetical protein